MGSLIEELRWRAGCVAPAPGDFEAHWAFHTRREHDRVHQARCQDGYDLIG
jgi:hypothetical protein